jgi:hypothetical protein
VRVSFDLAVAQTVSWPFFAAKAKVHRKVGHLGSVVDEATLIQTPLRLFSECSHPQKACISSYDT